jgi:capsule polysaccharide export protein KpsE/RkpR
MSLSRIENGIQDTRESHDLSAPPHEWPSWPDTLERLWNRRRRISLWVALGFAISIVFVTKYCRFEGTVQLMPPDGASSGLSSQVLPMLSKMSGLPNMAGGGLGSLAGDFLGGKSSGALFSKVLGSRTIQDSLVERFQLRQRYWRRYNEDARKILDSNTKIEEDKKSGVLTIIVRDADSKMAKDLANAYVEELDKVIARVSTSSARRERMFIELRLADEKKALEEAEQRFSQFSSSSMALDVPQQIRVTVESAARLQGELIAARAELEGLRQIYSPENTRVLTLTARVAELERQLRRINSGRADPGGTQDPTFPYPSVKNLPMLGVKWADLYRDSKVHETVFEMLTQQYEIARIQEAKEIPTVKVLDAAILPEKRHPRPWQILLAGLVLSTILAFCGVILQDKWEKWDSQDPRRIVLSRVYSGVHSMLPKGLRKSATGDNSYEENFKQSQR